MLTGPLAAGAPRSSAVTLPALLLALRGMEPLAAVVEAFLVIGSFLLWWAAEEARLVVDTAGNCAVATKALAVPLAAGLDACGSLPDSTSATTGPEKGGDDGDKGRDVGFDAWRWCGWEDGPVKQESGEDVVSPASGTSLEAGGSTAWVFCCGGDDRGEDPDKGGEVVAHLLL